jgi:hypothetical protein
VSEPVIPERFWVAARDIVFEKFRAIQMLNRPINRVFDWPPDELIKAIARALAAEAKVAEQAAIIAYNEHEWSAAHDIVNAKYAEQAATIAALTEALLKFRKQHVADLVCVEEFTNPSTPEYAPVDTRCWRCKLADAALNPQPSQPEYTSESMIQPKEKP